MTVLDRSAGIPVRPLAIVGAAVSLVGFVALVDLGVASTINFGSLALTIVGLVAMAEGVRLLVTARGVEIAEPDLGDPEFGPQDPALGEALNERLTSGALNPESAADLRDRFRDIAAEELAQSRRWSLAEARAALDDGSWTDDDVAAAFASPTVEYPVRYRLRARLRGTPIVAEAFERAIEALLSATDVLAASIDEDRAAHTGSDGSGSSGRPDGSDGSDRPDGSDGSDRPNGPDGSDGSDRPNGPDGSDRPNGPDGSDRPGETTPSTNAAGSTQDGGDSRG